MIESQAIESSNQARRQSRSATSRWNINVRPSYQGGQRSAVNHLTSRGVATLYGRLATTIARVVPAISCRSSTSSASASTDREAPGIGGRNLLEPRPAAAVALDRNDMRGALGKQRARQPAWPRSHFDDGAVRQWAA